MIDKMSAEQLALLTDEEREGLLEEIDEGEGDEDGGDDGADDTTATAAGAETGDDDTGGDDEDGENNGDDVTAAEAAAVAAPDAKAAEAAAAVEPPVVEQTTEEEPEEQAPRWILPADHQTKIDGIEAQKDALTEKFDDGELTGAEYRAQMKALDKQGDELKSLKIRADVARDTAIDTWRDDVATFMGEHPEYAKSKFLRNALDAEVRQLQSEAVNPLNPKILAKAHAKISGEITSAFKPTDPNPAGKPTGKQADPGKPAKKRDDPPPTLAHVPASDPTDADDGGEFAHLDRMLSKNDSLGYEKALAALPEAKREQYLAQ